MFVGGKGVMHCERANTRTGERGYIGVRVRSRSHPNSTHASTRTTTQPTIHSAPYTAYMYTASYPPPTDINNNRGPSRDPCTISQYAVYQIVTRSSTGINIASPSTIPKASYHDCMLRKVAFTRLIPSECTSTLVSRSFSWSVMFCAQSVA